MTYRKFYVVIGVLTAAVLGLVLAAWLSGLHGRIGIYDLFPILGLMAWSLMWLHYVSGSVKRYAGLAGDHTILRRYFQVTSLIVLVLILLHPALLYVGLYSDGLGLPPLSGFAVYTTVLMRVALVLGYLGLGAFLLFEFARRFRDRPWWRYVEYTSIVAMFVIFVHALILGGELAGWYRPVWLLSGVILVLSQVYNHWYDKHHM